MLTIILGTLTLIVAICRFIIHIKERNDKLQIQLLQNRRNELEKIKQIEFARETTKLSAEITFYENRVNGYPNIISLLNFAMILVGIATVISACFNLKN